MTQEDPLLPTIFDALVDEVVCHWESLVAGKMGGGNSDGKNAGHPMEGRTIMGKGQHAKAGGRETMRC